MQPGAPRREGRSVVRGPLALGLVGFGWLALVCASASHGQGLPTAPAPLPPRNGPGPGSVDDPFATPGSERPATPNDPTARPNQGPSRDLTTRYLLLETYAREPGGKAPAGSLSQYQVAFRETLTEMRDNAQGAPDQKVTTRLARFTERPVEVGPGDDRMVSTLVRRYEGARVDPNPWVKVGQSPLMEDLTVWYEALPGAQARLLSLTPGRSLLEQEHQFARGNPLVSDLAYVLPEFPVQIFDIWPVDRRGLSALLSTPVVQGDVSAKLADLRPSENANGGEMVAIIDLGGQVATQQGETRLHAQIEFTFVPSPVEKAPEPPPPGERADVPVEGHGGISKVRLTQVTAVPRQGADGPLGVTNRRSLVLQRRWPGDGPPLDVPETAPEATPENSWLTFVDLDGRFSIRYPQEYTHDYRFGLQNVVALMKTDALTANRPDSIFLAYFEGQQPRADTVFPGFFEKHRQGGFQVQSTAPTRLPPDEWPGAEVQRVEAALAPDPKLTPTNPNAGQLPQRLHFDGYLLRFTRNAALTAEAITAQDRSAAFRDEVEAILQTFRLGPPGEANP